jgi:ferredoxin
MSFKVIVDWDLCQDHGQCAFTAPEVFQIGDDGRMVVLVEEPDESLRGKVEDAADVCPVQAIMISG